jgi:uncharacterized protein with ParB-like and HNH nuclease domain
MPGIPSVGGNLKDVANVTFNEIISQAKTQFVIPIWQRTYAWEYDQWQDLWEDLTLLYEKRQKGELAQHFIGPIVIKTVEEKVGEITRRILIDGQQRLATLLLMCALIRDRAMDQGKKDLVEEIESDLLFNKHAKKTEYRPKLCPTEADRKTFYSIIDGEYHRTPFYGSQLSVGYDYFDLAMEHAEGKYDLETLLDCIRALKMVTIRLEEEDNPNRIFETLNFRGKKLAQSDLIRNYFMMAIRDEAKADRIYSDIWFPMQENFGSENLERAKNLESFFRHYMVMLKHETIKKDAVYNVVRERLKNSSEDETISELRIINRYSAYYEKLLFPDREGNMPARKGIDHLNRLKVGVHYPFLLKIYNGIAEGKISYDDFYSVLETIESYIVRRIVLKKSQAALNKLFADLCRLSEENVADSLRNELAARESWTTHYWPEDDKFKEAFRSLPIYSQITSERCHFILEALEEDFGHPERVNLDELWIEHVMPQTLDERWENYLGNDWERVHHDYLNNIGNLTLIATSPDQSLQNKLFSEKKKEWYSQSNIGLTKEINQKWNRWTEAEIKERANLLAERAVKIWPRPG